MKMKKFIAVLSMVAMIGTLAVGCGKSNEESKGEDAKTEASGDWDSSMDITIVSREDGSGTRLSLIHIFRRTETAYCNCAFSGNEPGSYVVRRADISA